MNYGKNESKKMKGQSGTEELPVKEPLLSTDTLTVDHPLNNGYSKKEGFYAQESELAALHADTNVKVAILSDDGFEEVELTSPKKALEEAGAHVEVISPHDGKIKAWNKTNWGQDVIVDKNLHDADPNEYDAVILPGGVMNPDKLRQNKDAILFLKRFINSGKPIAAICHGAQTLIETGMIDGKTMTSYPSLQTDLRNAGVNWVNKEMVHSGQFITSRTPSDLKSFNRELIYALSLRAY
jgi:protease I